MIQFGVSGLVGLCFVLLLAVSRPAAAQEQGRMEIGSSLAGITILKPDTGSSGVLVGVPSATFGIVNPSVYFSFFAPPHFALEPQIGVIVVSGGGSTNTLLSFAGQVDYFVRNARESSSFVFGSVGVLHVSGGGTTPALIAGGAGYRMREGDRLTLRMDGRVARATSGGGWLIGFDVAIGGVFGKS